MKNAIEDPLSPLMCYEIYGKPLGVVKNSDVGVDEVLDFIRKKFFALLFKLQDIHNIYNN